MDVKALEYMIEIAREANITKAAEKLYVTPSALNQQLLKLEKELGVPLFIRSKNRMVLTECGKIYIQNAKRMVQIRTETLQQIDDVTGNRKGTLSVGLTMDRGISMFLEVYPLFYQEYPGIKVSPMEMGVKRQIRMLLDGELDFGFLIMERQELAGLNLIPMAEEEILLAVPRKHPLAARANPMGKPYAEIDLKLFREEPFITMPRESTFREYIDTLFQKNGFAPQILMETSSNRTVISMVRCGLGCALTSETHAKYPDEVAYFRVPGAGKWKLSAATRKDAFISKPQKELIRLAKAYWNQTDEFRAISPKEEIDI